MSTKPIRNRILGGVIGVIVMVGSLVLVIFSPEIPDSTRFIFIGLILVFGLLILFSLVDRYYKKLLGGAMRASPSSVSNVSGLVEPESVMKPRGAPRQPFAYRVFDVNSKPDLSPAADTLLKRAYKHYCSYAGNLAIGALFLWVSFSSLAFVSALFLSQSSVSFNMLCGSGLALLAAFLIANPRRYLTSWTILVWGGMNILLLGVIVYIAIKSSLQMFTSQAEFGSAFVFLLGGGILAIYGVVFSSVASTLRRQVAANKPLQLLVLWVFNSANNLISTLSGIGLIWQFLGNMQFLRGGGLTVDMGDLVKKKKADLVVDTPEELERRLQAFKYVPGWSGTYPRNTLLCGDAVWKPAVHALLRDADAVAMSLFGFSESNQGCLYELGLLIDTFPIQRVLFLVDDSTDLDFLLATLSKNWDNMTVDSPNHTEADIPVRIYRLSTRFDRPLEGYILNKQGGQPVPGETPTLKALGAATAIQSGTAREVDCMLKLILEGLASQN